MILHYNCQHVRPAINLPNALTATRIFLVPLLVVVLLTTFEGRLIFGTRKELIGAAIFGHTFTPFVAVIVAFSMRQICMSVCTLPPPRGYIWRNPGFPTLLVTYDVGNDLFFSGHTALAVLGAIHAAHAGPPWLAITAGIIAFCEAIVVLVLRAHYTLDVVAGAFAAFVAYDIAMAISPSLDGWLP